MAGSARLSAKAWARRAPRRPGLPAQALHAATLGFVHPVTGESLRFERPLAPDMAELLAALGG
jgi:23S rRNA pseudouridine1911/1915/1917 synthase